LSLSFVHHNFHSVFAPVNFNAFWNIFWAS
jgi:hypothetical protein